MYKIIDYSDYDAGIKNYIVDTCEEVSTLPGDMGSEAYCLQDSKTYIKNGEDSWIEKIPSNMGRPGKDGVGIENVEKTKTEGLVDTYTITLTNGTIETFTVTNGKDGEQGPKGDNTPIKGEDYFTEEDIDDFSQNFVQRHNSSLREAYINENGVERTIRVVYNVAGSPYSAWHIACRSPQGTITVNDAIDEYDAINKRFFDNSLGDMKEALTQIITLQEHYIGGGE